MRDGASLALSVTSSNVLCDELVMPTQRKLIGSSIQNTRHSLALQALEFLSARDQALMGTLARIVQGTSLQFGQKVAEAESATLEYKLALDGTAKGLRVHVAKHLVKTIVGFLNGSLLGDRQERLKRIVFGISDDLCVRGYTVSAKERDEIEQSVNMYLFAVHPRHLFQANVHWIPVLGEPLRYVLEVMVLRSQQDKDTIFAELGDKRKIQLRLGPATYTLVT